MDYVFHCENPRCQKVTPVTGKQQALFDQCRDKGMTTAMGNCPICGWGQPFNPQDANGQSQNAKSEKLPAKASPSLTESYLSWLDGLGQKRAVSFDDSNWQLVSSKELAKQVTIDGVSAPYVEQARLYAKSLAEMMPHAVDTEEKPFPFSRIEQFLTIGEDNEDLLCVDPGDNFSVWRFAPGEGGYVEWLADSLEGFMREATG